MSSRIARRSATSFGEMVVCRLIRGSPYDSRMARGSRNASAPYWPYSRPKSSAENHGAVAGGNTRSIQNSAGARDDAAAQQRCLGEGHLLGHNGELVLMDQCPFGKATQAKTLKQANPITTHTRGIRWAAERRLGTSALKGATREALRTRPA